MPRNPHVGALTYSFGPGPITPAVRALLWANVGVYVASLMFHQLRDWFGLIPQLVIERHWIWQPITYMFLHDVRNFTHILFNMLGLWMFGVELERRWGTRFFVKYYAITGIGAAVTTIAVSLLPFAATSSIYGSVTVGASGALYGLLLAYALYYPE